MLKATRASTDRCPALDSPISRLPHQKKGVQLKGGWALLVLAVHQHVAMLWAHPHKLWGSHALKTWHHVSHPSKEHLIAPERRLCNFKVCFLSLNRTVLSFYVNYEMDQWLKHQDMLFYYDQKNKNGITISKRKWVALVLHLRCSKATGKTVFNVLYNIWES